MNRFIFWFVTHALVTLFLGSILWVTQKYFPEVFPWVIGWMFGNTVLTLGEIKGLLSPLTSRRAI